MTDMETEYRGYRLIYYERNDVWGPADHDLPIVTGTIAEVRKSIDQWEIDKQIAGGVKVWVIERPDPAYWSKRDAVFRTGGTLVDRTHMVRTRNFAGDPDSLYDHPRWIEALSAAPAPEGGAWSLDDMRELVSDEQVRHLVSATDVAQGRARLRDILNALATREEAPAEAGDTDRIGTHSPSCWSFGPRHYECALAEINRLRAQPQAREETQPVAWRARMKPDGEWMVLDAKYVPSRSADSAVEVQPLYTTPPAPEAEKLRVAVEALTALAGEEGDAGEKVYVPCAWVPFREVARQALAAMQAEQGAK